MAELWVHPKGIPEKELCWLKESREMVEGYNEVPSCEEPHTLCGSIKAQQEWLSEKLHKVHRSMKCRQEFMWPRAGKDTLWISYNKMMSIYSPLLSASRLSLYLHLPPPHCSVRLDFSCMGVGPPVASSYQTKWWWWWETDLLTTMPSKCVSKFSELVSPGAPPIILEYHLQPDWPSVYI